MSFYPASWENYFYALRFGILEFLPHQRTANQNLLLAIDDGLRTQEKLTKFDTTHLATWKALADTITIPDFSDVKTACNVESYLVAACPSMSSKSIKYALRWAVYLLAKNNEINADVSTIDGEIRLWRRINQLGEMEQGFVTALIGWMAERQFSLNDQNMTIRYYQRLLQWMSTSNIQSLGHLTDDNLRQFLNEMYGHWSNSSQQRVNGALIPVFAFYKQLINPYFKLPQLSIPVSRCLGSESAASAKIINAISKKLRRSDWDVDTRLMLTLLIFHGLPLKALPLLTVADLAMATLTWQRTRPNRTGHERPIVQLELAMPWVAALWHQYLAQYPKNHGDYLFATPRSAKQARPMHSDTIQRRIQKTIKDTLGYSVTVSQLGRGALKQQARVTPLHEFMHQTHHVPLSRKNRLRTWLAHNPNA